MITFKNLIILLFLIGAIIVTREITKMTYECPSKEIEYKYMPRSLDMDIKDSADVDKIFKTMFESSEPWLGTSRADSNKIRKLTNNQLPSFNPKPVNSSINGQVNAPVNVQVNVPVNVPVNAPINTPVNIDEDEEFYRKLMDEKIPNQENFKWYI